MEPHEPPILLHSYMRDLVRDVIAPYIPSQSLARLARTCRGMYKLLRSILAKRKKSRQRTLQHKRAESRSVVQYQPQPQIHEFICRAGPDAKFKNAERNLKRLIRFKISALTGWEFHDIYVDIRTDDRTIATAYFIDDGVVISSAIFKWAGRMNKGKKSCTVCPINKPKRFIK